ncbi:MAG: hypothetical protein GX022_01790 [Clostridiaceae bacterium]|nr:hypothetical protein [Clostridiaceae bacterium]
MINKRIYGSMVLFPLIIALVFFFLVPGSINSNAAVSTGNAGYVGKKQINPNSSGSDSIDRFPLIETSGMELKLIEKYERYNEKADEIRETYAIKIRDSIIGYLLYDSYILSNGDLYYYLKYEPEGFNLRSISIMLPFIFDEFDLRTIEYPEGLDQTKSVIRAYEGLSSDDDLLSTLEPGSVYIDSVSLNGFFSYSSIYETGANKIRKELYDKAKNIQITGDGVKVTLPAAENAFSEQWGIISKEKLVDWDDETAVEAVKTGDLSRVRKWGGDGQYYFLPYGYAPYSSNGFYRNSANHIGNKYLGIEGRFFEDYAYITIDTLTKTQNSEGYWGTDPMAVGLYDNYKVGAGFFDTRWDTEAALSLLRGYRKFNEPLFLKAANKYAEFYCDFAVSNAYVTENQGLLVYDYGFNATPGIKTHVSLNHLVNEMNFLLEMYNSTAKSKYLQMAKRILTGISDTAEEWINHETGDLFYGYYGDGKYDVEDYPTLTLDDLRYAQVLLTTLYSTEDTSIKMLIKVKEEYLARKGIVH